MQSSFPDLDIYSDARCDACDKDHCKVVNFYFHAYGHCICQSCLEKSLELIKLDEHDRF